MKSERSHNRTPNDKVNRYLQRIEKLVGTRNRSPSPISGRTNKSQSINTLDHFLKFQLTFKILNNYLERATQKHMMIFFNNLRGYESKQAQTVYRFVSIQKQRCTHTNNYMNSASKNIENFSNMKKSSINIDSDISIKLMIVTLKNCLKSKISESFHQIVKFRKKTEDYETKAAKFSPKDSLKKDQTAINYKLQTKILTGIIRQKIVNSLQIAFFKIKAKGQQPRGQHQANIEIRTKIMNLANLINCIICRRVSHSLYQIKQYDINMMFVHEIRFTQAQFQTRNFQHMIGRYIGYCKWKTIYTITSLSKDYVISKKFEVQLSQDTIIKDIEYQTPNQINQNVRKSQQKYKNVFEMIQTLIKIHQKPMKNFFRQIKQHSFRADIQLLNKKFAIQKIVKLASSKVKQEIRFSFWQIRSQFMTNESQKSQSIKQTNSVAQYLYNTCRILNEFQKILNKRILQQKQSFYLIQDFSLKKLKLQKIGFISDKFINFMFFKRVKTLARASKGLQILQIYQQSCFKHALKSIFHQSRTVLINRKMHIFIKIEKVMLFSIIQAFTILRIREPYKHKQNIRDDVNCQISSQNFQFLKMRRNSQIQYESKLNRLKQIIINKRKE